MPLIKECVDHLERKLGSKCTTGDHRIFVGEIVRAYMDKGAFAGSYDLKKRKMVFHSGRGQYSTIEYKASESKG